MITLRLLEKRYGDNSGPNQPATIATRPLSLVRMTSIPLLLRQLLWIMFDDDDHVVLASDNRSKVFFFATEHEIPLHRIQ